MIRLYFIILLFLAPMVGMGQDFKQAILETRKVYEQIERLHAVIDIKVFEGASSATPYYAETADIKRDKQNYLYHYSANDMLMNEKYLILADKNAREISISKRDLKGEAALRKDPVQVNIDSLLKNYDQAVYLGRKENTDHYQLVQNTGALSKTDIFLDVQRKLIRRIEYHYREGQRVFITFKVFDRQPQFGPDTFHEKRFFVVTKGKRTVSDLFRGYTISE